MSIKAPYRPVSKALPIMPEQHTQDTRKGTVPKAHKLDLTLSDLHRVGAHKDEHKGHALYKPKGF